MGTREYRVGFDADSDRVEKDEVYESPEAAEGTYFYRFILAPGEGRETAADLYDWTRHVMDRLEERAGDVDWVAWEHRDHSNHDDVHVIAVLDRRLDRDDLRDLREHADDVWQPDRERFRDPLTRVRALDAWPGGSPRKQASHRRTPPLIVRDSICTREAVLEEPADRDGHLPLHGYRGSTALLQRLGARPYAEVLAEHERLLGDAFAKGAGHMVAEVFREKGEFTYFDAA